MKEETDDNVYQSASESDVKNKKETPSKKSKAEVVSGEDILESEEDPEISVHLPSY